MKPPDYLKVLHLAFALTLMACQSDEQRAATLRAELTTAQLLYQNSEEKCHVLTRGSTPAHPASISDPRIRACYDTLMQRQTRLDMAERAYNRFMHR